MLTVFAALAELERETTLQRQAEGIAIAKENGIYKGRKRLEVDEALFVEQYRLWKSDESSPKFICKKLGISYSTFMRRVAEYEKKVGVLPNSKEHT